MKNVMLGVALLSSFTLNACREDKHEKSPVAVDNSEDFYSIDNFILAVSDTESLSALEAHYVPNPQGGGRIYVHVKSDSYETARCNLGLKALVDNQKILTSPVQTIAMAGSIPLLARIGSNCLTGNPLQGSKEGIVAFDLEKKPSDFQILGISYDITGLNEPKTPPPEFYAEHVSFDQETKELVVRASYEADPSDVKALVFDLYDWVDRDFEIAHPRLDGGSHSELFEKIEIDQTPIGPIIDEDRHTVEYRYAAKGLAPNKIVTPFLSNPRYAK